MDSDQLDTIMRAHCPTFLGVFPADMIPKVSAPYCFIVNNQGSRFRGQHWMAVFARKGRIEFFDPFGFGPEAYKLKISANVINKTQVQPIDSDSCGLHTLYYLHQRCNGVSLTKIVHDHYQKNLYYNDVYVFLYFFDKVFKPILNK